MGICSLELENSMRSDGRLCVAGVDEAGRGPLAGPVFAAAVCLPADFSHPTLNDSKKMTPARREAVYEELRQRDDILIASALATVEEIDHLNILRATHLAMKRAVLALVPVPDFALIDGRPVQGFPIPHKAVVGGDGISLSIAAASVVAKVERDRHMHLHAARFPAYGFDKHKGYGTRQHLLALQSHGPCPLHRKSFAPVAQLTRQE